MNTAVMNRCTLLILVGLFFLIAIPRLMFPELEHGDEWADTAALNSADNFATYGFSKFHFLPLQEFWTDPKKEPYTHYPPLTQLFWGVLRVLFKTRSLYFYRSCALLMSLFNLLFWFLFIKRFSGSNVFGFLAAIFYLTNPFFIYGMDSLAQLNSSDLVRAAVFFMFLLLINAAPEKRRRYVWGLWVLLVVESWITFEYIVYLSLFFVLYKLLFKEARGSIPWKTVFILWSAPVFGFFLHFLQNAWYFGSVSLAYQDLRGIGIERVIASKDSSLALTFANWWKYVIAKDFSSVFLFNRYIVSSCGVCAFFLYFTLSPEAKAASRRTVVLLILLGFCGISWYALFPAHTLAHTFIQFQVHHLVPVAALAFALWIYLVLAFIKMHGANFFKKGILAALVIVIAVTGVSQSALPVTRDDINSARDFLAFKKCLTEFKAKLGDNDAIGSNYYRHFFMGYYLRRTCVPVFSAPMLLGRPELPQYFIFLPFATAPSMELFKVISDKYAPLFQCASRRFPFVFFKLKQ